jgi:hypothetical protein
VGATQGAGGGEDGHTAGERLDHHEPDRLFPADREDEGAATLLVMRDVFEGLIVWA